MSASLDKQKIEAIFFDLDGTLLDSAPTFAKVLNQQLANHNKAPLDFDIIRATVSNGARALIELAFEINEDHDDFETKRNELLDLYENNLSDGTTAFAGIDALLAQIRSAGIKWGIITNKPSRFTLPLLKQLGYFDNCDVIICPDDVQNTKPDPEPIFLACEKVSVEAKNCIYVGDHIRDIEAGKAADMPTIAAAYGYVNLNDNITHWHADYIVKHADEITSLIFRPEK